MSVFTANVFKSVFAAPSSAGDVLIWTPESGKTFRVLQYFLEFPTSNHKLSSNLLTLTFKEESTELWTHNVYIPVTALNNLGAFLIARNLDNGYLAQAADNQLYLNFDQSLNGAGNGVRVNVWGLEV